MTHTEQVTHFVIRRDWYETSAGSFHYFSDAQSTTNTAENHLHRESASQCDICRAGGVEWNKGCAGTLEWKHSIQMAKASDLCKALNSHLKRMDLQPDEYGFDPPVSQPDLLIPEKHRWLIAFAIEGSSEGYYVHLAAVIPADNVHQPVTMVDLGLAKTYSPDNAYALAREAQRFLTSASWN